MGILKAGLWAMLQDIRGMYSMLGYGLGFKSYVVCTQCWAMGYTLRKKDLFIVLRVSDHSHWLNANIGLKLAKNAQKWCKK